MVRSLKSLAVAALMGLVCTVSASAQIIAVPLITWKYSQPWTQPWHSHASIVRDCNGTPMTFAPIAMDDWICTASGPIVRLRWWGTSPQPNQTPNRQFLIRIYSGTTAACTPQQLLYSVCVLASNQLVGYDCRDRKVYRFQATLPTPFTQQAGNRYWLQISEVDGVAGGMQSPTLNAVDFEWSAHRNVKNCNALQRSAAGVITQPLLDACDNLQDDLAFVLYRSGLIVHVPVPVPSTVAGLPNSVYIAEFRRASDGALADTQCFSPDNDGSAGLHPELAPGSYRMTVRGMSSRAVDSFFDIFTELEATGAAADYFLDLGDVAGPQGDVDGDGDIDFADLTGVLVNWHP